MSVVMKYVPSGRNTSKPAALKPVGQQVALALQVGAQGGEVRRPAAPAPVAAAYWKGPLAT